MSGGDASSGQNADPVIPEAIAQALEKVRELRKVIMEARVRNEYDWFRNLLLGILNCALHDYKSVEIGAQKSVYLMAWGTRNLLELKVIASHVLASEKNATEFKSDFLIDLKEFYEAVTRSHEATHAKFVSVMCEAAEQENEPMKEVLRMASQREAERGPQTQASDSEAAMYRQLMSEYGLKQDAKPKRASQIAERMREKENFDPMFKVCSKIMHRTALSIASSTTHGSLDASIPLLRRRGASELLSIYDAINNYVEENGLRPPEN
jgi:hypothetical protein